MGKGGTVRNAKTYKFYRGALKTYNFQAQSLYSVSDWKSDPIDKVPWTGIELTYAVN